MEYQVTINYRFAADSEDEAREKAAAPNAAVSHWKASNLTIKAVPEALCNPLEVADKCRSFRKTKKEHFVVFFLDTHHNIIGRETVSVGTLNTSLVHPRECYRTAILKNSAAVIFAHNHPSGSLEPSLEDVAVTKRLVEVGKLIGIEVLDHVIVTSHSHKSLKEAGLI
jgi:DNA repair protein RadC